MNDVQGIRRSFAVMRLLLILGLAACSLPPAAEQGNALMLGGPTPAAASFDRAFVPVPLELPRDHGPHESFQSEWWYYTGNLRTQDGRRFGYQFTIFRRGLSPGLDRGSTGFTTNQIYFAHFALTDVSAGEHMAVERFSRGAAGLAGGSGDPFRVWLEDWSVEGLNADGSKVKLQAVDPGFGLDLVLEAQKPLALHGDQGLSAKSDLPGNASYYLSYTRMQAAGRVRVGDTTFVVEGTSWFDHEWSTSALETADVGWDWFGLQLGDGRDLMLYWIRRADGSFEPVSGGTLIQPDGSTIPLSMGEVLISVESTWTSPHSGAEYPGAWRIDLPAYDLVLSIEPLVQDQELQLSFTYWEGAVRISGMSAGSIVEGMGYIELTGYDASMGGVF